jgi:hypothetical protein
MYVFGTPVYHSYNKAGRIFTTLGSLRTFITNVMNNEYKSSNLGDWEIVELEMQEKNTKEIHEIIKPDKLVKLLKQ